MTTDHHVRPTGPSGAPAAAADLRGEAVVDTGAITGNVRRLLAHARTVNPAGELMAVVKANGYGHGDVPAARAALAGGAGMLGVATPAEAVRLRVAGVTEVPLLAWLWLPGTDLAPALDAGVTLAVSHPDHLAAVLAAVDGGAGRGGPVDVHVKVDTGLGRNGVPALAPGGPVREPGPVGTLLAGLAAAERSGRVRLTGVMSHLASADVPGDPSVGEQTALFTQVLAAVDAAGLRPRWRHLANTAATLDHPGTVFDLVRCGIGVYGLDPTATDPTGPGTAVGRSLRPAMTLRAAVALTKRVPAGAGVSYGLTYRTPRESTLALVPLGYADGIPRAASSVAEVSLGGRRRRVAGRVAMDQFVLDVGDEPVRIGDEVLLFGPGDAGEPTATEWADRTGTIDYEIVTRIGARVPRRWIGPGTDGGPAERDTGLRQRGQGQGQE
ncbi:alanine racemase [Nakamurella leprariae]|uniref:Alanine racemase n=1 Tax=Nakamurella leprariae TaxID=2803911 RepID=A0A939BWI2_9ACTN|nr:alanine racemase [Nakamurella leprariae]MBM9467573.1 alanine racemase [Nakamurella leprariae]